MGRSLRSKNFQNHYKTSTHSTPTRPNHWRKKADPIFGRRPKNRGKKVTCGFQDLWNESSYQQKQ